MIERTIYQEIKKAIKEKPVVVITGARQVGKTMLCTDRIEKELGFSYVSLADPILRISALEDPKAFLSLHPAPLIIDEIQKAPILFDYLEGEVDELKRKGNKASLYILTGSEAYKLKQSVSESMRGRVTFIHMSPLSMSEIYQKEEKPFTVSPKDNMERVSSYQISTLDLYDYIVKGFYPELYDNPDLDPAIFYSDYIESYLTKDVDEVLQIKDKSKFLNLITLLASLTGEELNYTELSKEIGVDVKTVSSWISVLEAGNLIHLLQPYNDSSIKRQIIKRPKVYFSDTGLACYLAKVNSKETLIASYLKGHMLETYIINEILKSYSNNRKDKSSSFYYYRDSQQNEIDLIILNDGKLTALECKSGEQYSSKDLKGTKVLKTVHYPIASKAIICTCKSVYPIGDECYLLPVTAI